MIPIWFPGRSGFVYDDRCSTYRIAQTGASGSIPVEYIELVRATLRDGSRLFIHDRHRDFFSGIYNHLSIARELMDDKSLPMNFLAYTSPWMHEDDIVSVKTLMTAPNDLVCPDFLIMDYRRAIEFLCCTKLYEQCRRAAIHVSSMQDDTEDCILADWLEDQGSMLCDVVRDMSSLKIPHNEWMQLPNSEYADCRFSLHSVAERFHLYQRNQL